MPQHDRDNLSKSLYITTTTPARPPACDIYIRAQVDDVLQMYVYFPARASIITAAIYVLRIIIVYIHVARNPKKSLRACWDGKPNNYLAVQEPTTKSCIIHPPTTMHLFLHQQADLVSLLSCFGQVEKIKMFSGQVLFSFLSFRHSCTPGIQM